MALGVHSAQCTGWLEEPFASWIGAGKLWPSNLPGCTVGVIKGYETDSSKWVAKARRVFRGKAGRDHDGISAVFLGCGCVSATFHHWVELNDRF